MTTPSALSAAVLSAEAALASELAVVVDVRDAQAYQASHVPGAIHLGLAAWEHAARTADGDLQNLAAWRARIGALGIAGDRPVLVYDDGRATEAARAWFILQWVGVDAHVIDGGWPSLQAAPGFTPDNQAHQLPPTQFVAPLAHVPRVGLVTRDTLKQSIGGPVQVLDARTAAEYRGEDLRKNPRGGHVPGAHLLSHALLLTASGRLRPADELQALFAQASLSGAQPVVTHCDAGGRAALAALAAVQIGLPDVSVYYLSFSDWAQDGSCPIEA